MVSMRNIHWEYFKGVLDSIENGKGFTVKQIEPIPIETEKRLLFEIDSKIEIIFV